MEKYRVVLGFFEHWALINTEPHGLVSSELCIFVLNLFKQMPLSRVFPRPFTHGGRDLSPTYGGGDKCRGQSVNGGGGETHEEDIDLMGRGT